MFDGKGCSFHKFLLALSIKGIIVAFHAVYL
jgi:hypothetical protein